MDKKTNYKFLADLVKTIHFIWIAFMVLSVPIAIFFPSFGIIILFFFTLMLVMWFFYKNCPITDLEKNLLKRYAPEQVYTESFFTYNLEKYFKIRATDRQIAMISYAILIILILIVIRPYLLK